MKKLIVQVADLISSIKVAQKESLSANQEPVAISRYIAQLQGFREKLEELKVDMEDITPLTKE